MDSLFQRGILLSDFNIANLAGYLRQELLPAPVTLIATPYGQIMTTFLQPDASLWEPPPDFAVVWTRPESAAPSFQGALDFSPVRLRQVLDEVDQFAIHLLDMAARLRCTVVPTWSIPGDQRGLGMLDLRHPTGVGRLLLQMNLRLVEKLDAVPNVYVLDAHPWIRIAGKNAFTPKLWYLAKTPFGNEVFKAAARDIAASLNGAAGQAKKLVLLDLDDTLWGGIVGEVGWENLRLGGHDFVGESYSDFQRALKALTRRGVLLGLVSRNEESTAVEAIRHHPEMVLRLEDFAGWRINWKDKAANIADLAAELNLGLQSVVFIDDNAVERARVREALPEVLVPEWPEDCMLYASALRSLACFDAPVLSPEDRQRTAMYQAERQRQTLKSQVTDLKTWLRTLEIKVQVQALAPANLPRAAQLLNKTNQMNLASRRLSESQLWDWACQPGHECWTFRISDRCGDAGLAGLGSLRFVDGAAQIVDFLLSCRVLGRYIEEAMLHTLVERARGAGARDVQAQLLPTEKNKPMVEFWEKRSGFSRRGAALLYWWDGCRAYPAPEGVRIVSEPPVAN